MSDSKLLPRTFSRVDIEKISTGSRSFDTLLGGGLPVTCVTDIFGPAGTGKTQFAFQNAITTCAYYDEKTVIGPNVVFVDCAGSFRPERIVEICESRELEPTTILDRISSISVRKIEEQFDATNRLLFENLFPNCRLVIVDDVTSNFVSDYSDEKDMILRQRSLSIYARQLASLASIRGLSIILTNSVRSRAELGDKETTGDILSEFALYRVQFSRVNGMRYASLVQPDFSAARVRFEISNVGIA